jgi:hypothetical protein
VPWPTPTVNLLLRANRCRIEAERCDDRRLKVLLLRSAKLFKRRAGNKNA